MGPATILESHKSNTPSTSAIVNDGDDFTADSSFEDISKYPDQTARIKEEYGKFSVKKFINKLSSDLNTTITYHENGGLTKAGSSNNNVPSFGSYITFDDYASSNQNVILSGIPRSIFFVDTSGVTINAPTSPSTSPTAGLYFMFIKLEETITFGLGSQAASVVKGIYFIHDFIRVLKTKFSTNITFDGDDLIFADITQNTSFTISPASSNTADSGITNLDSQIYNISNKTLTAADNKVPFVTF